MSTQKSAMGRAEHYAQFWTKFLQRVQVERSDWTNAQRPGRRNWKIMPCPFKGGPRCVAAFSRGGRIKTELYIDYGEVEDNVALSHSFTTNVMRSNPSTVLRWNGRCFRRREPAGLLTIDSATLPLSRCTKRILIGFWTAELDSAMR